ncbi:MAG TPA: primosomal protein N' [Verrucomicrobiales bacterium]|nr:primosomal protein N' [Verrucomicrobiales bacterium]
MIARVTLEIALRREFDYLVPEELRDLVDVGTRVKVPFGHRQVLGVVTEVADDSPHTNLKTVIRVIGGRSLVTPKILELARWIADYYCCPLEIALKSVLPESVRREKESWKKRLHVRALTPAEEVPKLTKKQEYVWNIIEEWRELPMAELVRLGETTPDTIRRLEDKGMVVISEQTIDRDPYANEQILPTQPLALNAEQAGALAAVLAALGEGPSADAGAAGSGGRGAHTFLLHGVTGSGKTEVYLQAIARCLELGRGAIVLVPEISLTPQTVERFKARFSSGPGRTLVAVLHSHLSAGEKHDEWHKIRQGRARIVIGARSAIFAPVDPLGLIIVDEEHEHSYKQEEAPRYHARDLAVLRGQREGAVVVLGSATPSMESYHNAVAGKYRLLELPHRADDARMPVVRVVDMRQETRRQKGSPIFSVQLREAILQRLERKEQTILFLNRRGYATSMQCPACGFVAECPNCSVALTFHRREQKLKCHICGYDSPAPAKCPEVKCGSREIRFAGLGTEKVEDALKQGFPQANVSRMDSDTLKRKEDYRRILTEFRVGKIDILIGTQMIAKGLHFPNVTLVGIIYADLSLHLPDFRAGERTFQLLTQVAGRSGRGDIEGEVFVQSFTPFHPAIQYARRHDFVGFYEQELEFRQQLKYPPVSRIAMITLKGRNEEKVAFLAEHLRKEMEPMLKELEDLVIAGPAPAPLARAETFYRHQLMLRTRHMGSLSRRLSGLLQHLKLPDGVTATVDIDPVSLF